MNLSDVQTYVSAQIMANPTLAAFGAPLIVSPLTPDEDQRKAVQDRLRAANVCIEIGPVGYTAHGDEPVPRQNTGHAHFDVFVSETPKTGHALTEVALVQAVVTAVQARVDSRTIGARCLGYQPAVAEHGYALYFLTFFMPVIL